jgi:hypothetical protein
MYDFETIAPGHRGLFPLRAPNDFRIVFDRKPLGGQTQMGDELRHV